LESEEGGVGVGCKKSHRGADAAVLEHLRGGVVLLLRVLACGGPGSVAVREGLEHGEEHAL
jgi:hypothetical protein